MSYNQFDYPKLPLRSDALQDADTIPFSNASVGSAPEQMTIADLRGQMLYSTPVASYVGPTLLTNEITFGNFKVRINGLAFEITAVAGTETVEIYMGALWGAGAAQGLNYNAQVLTAGTWFVTDTWILDTGDDMDTYWISRTNIIDKAWWQIKVWRSNPGKCQIQVQDLSTAPPSSIAAVGADFFRKNNGAVTPDGLGDYTAPVTHDGFLGLGMTADPIAPLEFGDAIRNDIVRLWDNALTNSHQFRGFGIGATELRYQVEAPTASHVFWGGSSTTASTRYATLGSTFATIGDISSAVGTSHWTFRTDGKMQWRSPNSSAATNKIGAQIYCNGPAGVGGITGTAFDIQTAATNATENLISRFLINNAGDILVSDPATPYLGNNIAFAKMTINGALRLRSGPIVPGLGMQSNGLVFGAGTTNGTLALGAETDGGISSIADNNLTFYNNGVVAGDVTGGIWSKTGGGSWAVLSDIRTKKNVTPYVASPEKLLALETITYQHNGLGGSIDDGRTYTGFSAQAVRQLFPDWVNETRETIGNSPVLQVDPSNLVHELLALAKQLEARVSTLEASKK
jgi:hypothetical protein